MRLFISLWVLLIVCSTSALAEEAEQYEVKSPVESRSNSERQSAMLAAFKEVIVRASGTQSALEAFYVQESYNKVSSFIRTYAYRDEKIADTNDKQLFLVVEFDGRAVRRLLQDAAVPMWGGSRPVTLMWIAYEENMSRKVLSASSRSEEVALKVELNKQAERRALPMVLPLMDLEDEMQVSASDIWARFPEPIEAASERYGSDAVLAGRVVEHNDSWQGRFLINISGDISYQDFEALSQQDLLRDVTDWLGESLCQVYCVTESFNINQWQLLIQDVGSFYSYRSLMNYLEALSAIRKVEVALTKQRSLVVNVDLVGSVDSLKQAINLDQKLIPVTDALAVQQALENIKRQPEPETADPAQDPLRMIDPDSAESAPVLNVGEPKTTSLNGSSTESSSLEQQPEKILVYRWRP